MFNLYQHMNRHAEGKEQKEPETTGHDRFYQERSRSSFRKKKKKGCRRAQSAAELNPASIAAANRRAKFGIRSMSTDREESEASNVSLDEENSEKGQLVAQKIDSIAKLLFNKSIIGSPSGSVKSLPFGDLGAAPRVCENTVENAAATSICTQYLAQSSRYELIAHLNDIGSRTNRHWFAVRDNSIKTERLLTLVPLGNKCPIEPSERSRSLILELFRALHHPYIYPVLDVAFCSDFVLAVIPFNARGSMKDLIYNSCWNDDWSKKYGERGNGLPLWQIGRLGRQILEGLLFLKERGFPPFKHLHTGNVMVQNGVARISGLEMTLVGASPRSPFIQSVPAQHVEIASFGHVLFEMCSGYELDVPKPQPGHLQLDLDRYPQIVEILEMIFNGRSPTLHELLLCELFRKIDLREMKGSCLPNFNQRLSGSCISLLGEVTRRQGVNMGFRTGLQSEGSSPLATSPPVRRRHYTSEDVSEDWHWLYE